MICSECQENATEKLFAEANEPVNCDVDGHTGLAAVVFKSAKKGEVGVGDRSMRGVRGARVFFRCCPKVCVGRVDAGYNADGVGDHALHLQLRIQVFGRGHGLDAGMRVVPTEHFHAIFFELCAALKHLHVAHFYRIRPQELGVPACVLMSWFTLSDLEQERTDDRGKSARCKWCAAAHLPCPQTCPCSRSHSRTARGAKWRIILQPECARGSRHGAWVSAS